MTTVASLKISNSVISCILFPWNAKIKLSFYPSILLYGFCLINKRSKPSESTSFSFLKHVCCLYKEYRIWRNYLKFKRFFSAMFGFDQRIKKFPCKTFFGKGLCVELNAQKVFFQWTFYFCLADVTSKPIKHYFRQNIISNRNMQCRIVITNNYRKSVWYKQKW